VNKKTLLILLLLLIILNEFVMSCFTRVVQVKFLDLTLPQYWLPRYDWVLCIEVLEHIPPKFENVAIDTIDRTARHGVVLSWAVPSQFGYFHVNNRSPKYVNRTMFERGLMLDFGASRALREQSTNVNLKKNVNVFVRK